MSDLFYPSVDLDFVIENVLASGKVVDDGVVKFGSTTTFVLKGQQAIYKRSILIRALEDGHVCLEQATHLAVRFNFLHSLLTWLETNKNWKEGAYIEVDKESAQ